MTKEDFYSLQIGMYVTDVDKARHDDPCSEEYNGGFYAREDFCSVQQFDRMGRIKLQPVDANGNPSATRQAFWIHYKDYDLRQKFYRSDYIMNAS